MKLLRSALIPLTMTLALIVGSTHAATPLPTKADLDGFTLGKQYRFLVVGLLVGPHPIVAALDLYVDSFLGQGRGQHQGHG